MTRSTTTTHRRRLTRGPCSDKQGSPAARHMLCEAAWVLVVAQHSGRGRASGAVYSGSLAATVFHIRDGKVTRLVVYGFLDRALADLGLQDG